MKPAVTIPERMKHLPRDHRGYPIFFIAQWVDGKPLFTANDSRKQEICARDDLCEICGTKLFRGRWFIGGPMSAFHAQGCFNDAPMHDECAHFSLNVCPWLSAAKYGEAIAQKQVEQSGAKGVLTHDPSDPLMKYRPPLFVALMAVDQMIAPHSSGVGVVFRPKRPYRKVEFWQHGKQLSEAEGRDIVIPYMREQSARLGR